ncbi:MAG: prepilin peptidase [Pirellulaceae bacterium]|nr:prepilin peptidase [Pirellulaceae bacterium]
MSDPHDTTTFDPDPIEATQPEGPNNAFRSVLLIVALFLLLSIAYSQVTAAWRWDRVTAGLGLEHESVALRWFLSSTVAEILLIWWVVAVCGTIGSFLNVVVYRMPRGLSLSSSGSRCVHCQTPIKWYDNQPVLGWVILSGRCRKCRGPISGRYPLVEFMAIVVGLILFFVTVQITWIGPPRTSLSISDPNDWYCFWLLDPVPARPLIMYFYLLPTLMACLAIGWSSFDGVRLPSRFYLATLMVGVVGAVLFQTLLCGWLAEQFGRQEWRDVQFLSPSLHSFVSDSGLSGLWGHWHVAVSKSVVVLIGQGIGIVCGTIIGWFLTWTVMRLIRSNREVASQSAANFTLLGVVGGWYLPLAVASLWSVEILARWGISRVGSAEKRLADQHALWFGLPFYFLIAVAFWRWFP